MNVAGLVAALNSDMENAKIAATPGGIEAQERAGQIAFVGNESLPIECNGGTTRAQLETIGIVYGEPIDDLFVSVKLPDGWQKVCEGHAMWSKLIDDQGRERASMFYKAAFYDRSAFINIKRRYSVHVDPVSGWDDENYRQSKWHCVVTDAGTAIWTSEAIEQEPEYHGQRDGPEREAWLSWYEQKDGLASLGRAWADEHYPDWQNPTAYWD